MGQLSQFVPAATRRQRIPFVFCRGIHDRKRTSPDALPARRAGAAEVAKTAKKVEQAEFVGSLLDTVPGPALVINEHHQVVAANHRTLEFLSLDSMDQILGQRHGEALGCDVPDRAPGGCGTAQECRYCGLVNTIVTSVEQDGTARGMCRIARTGGDALDLEVAATPQKIEGQPLVFVGMRDISADKRREVLERTFLHDLLNTAGGISGLLTLLASSKDLSEQTVLKDDMLDMSTVLVEEIKSYRQLLEAEAGKLEAQPREVFAHKLIEGLRALYAGHEVAKGKSLSLDRCDDVQLESDPALLRRVIGNMIKNALEATPTGGEVRIGVRDHGQEVTFRVSNPGVMPEPVRAQIFRRSFSTKGAGRGLGTYSIKLFGERYLGGQVQFTSIEPEGTVFTITVPKAAQGSASGVARDDQGQGTGRSADEEREARRFHAHVLLAEDNIVNRKVAQKMLERRGCTVSTAENGRQALEAADDEAFDLILMDVQMPEMGGLEAARAIRSREAGDDCRVPIVALTGGSLEADGRECLEAGMDSFLEKPIGDDEIVRVLREFARHDGATRSVETAENR